MGLRGRLGCRVGWSGRLGRGMWVVPVIYIIINVHSGEFKLDLGLVEWTLHISGPCRRRVEHRSVVGSPVLGRSVAVRSRWMIRCGLRLRRWRLGWRVGRRRC